MNSIANNDFQIADLIAVKYREDYLDYLDLKTKEQLKDVTFYPDVIYFVDRITTFDNGFYREYYNDVLYALDIFEREGREPFRFEPEFLEEVPFPKEFLSEEELEKGIITRWRLFTIFQEVNNGYQKDHENTKVKKIGTKLNIPRVGW